MNFVLKQILFSNEFCFKTNFVLKFSKMSETQKNLEFLMEWGGAQAYLGIFPKFFRFFYDGSPKIVH